VSTIQSRDQRLDGRFCLHHQGVMKTQAVSEMSDFDWMVDGEGLSIFNCHESITSWLYSAVCRFLSPVGFRCGLEVVNNSTDAFLPSAVLPHQSVYISTAAGCSTMHIHCSRRLITSQAPIVYLTHALISSGFCFRVIVFGKLYYTDRFYFPSQRAGIDCF
jgi:hypothetical protein